MVEVFLQIFNMSIVATYVIAAVLVVRLMMSKLPKKYSYWLWGIVGLRLICPFSFSSIFSIFNLGFLGKKLSQAQSGGFAGSLQNVQNISADNGTLNHALNSILPGTMPVGQSLQIGISAMQSAGSQSGGQVLQDGVEAHLLGLNFSELSLSEILLFAGTCIWLLGIIAFLVSGIVSYVKTKKMISQAVLYNGSRYCCPDKIKIYECDNIASPFVAGFIKPAIYIPFRMNEDELRYILGHETYHIRRKDYIIKFVAFFIRSVYWFNPLVWLAYFFMNRDMEMSCDEKVLAELGNEIKKDYSTLLLAFAVNKRSTMGMLAFGETDIKKRVKNVLNFRQPKFWTGAAGFIIIFIIAAMCLTNRKNDDKLNSNDNVQVQDYDDDKGYNYENLYIQEEESTEAPTLSLHDKNNFEYWNKYDWFNGFVISEAEVDGAYYYKFYNETENVTILVNSEETRARVTTATASADITLPSGMWGASTSGRFYLTDVTGDGRKELIYDCGSGGTGVWYGSISIYDTSDMSEYYIDKNIVYDLEKQVALEALYMDTENSALCRVTGPKEFSNYLYIEAYRAESAKPEEFSLEPDGNSSHVSYSVVENESDGGATASIEVEVAIPYPEIVGYGIYVGEVTDTLVYDADENIFRLAGNAEFSQDDSDWVVDIGFSHFNGSDKVYIYEDWKITVKNKFKHENIEQFYFMGFLEQNDSGEWEYLDCLMDFSRLEHVIPSESLIEIEMKPKWFKDIKADNYYTAAFKCNLKVGDGQYEEVWFYKNVYVSK